MEESEINPGQQAWLIIHMPSSAIRRCNEEPVRCTFQKTIDLQLFTLEPYAQVRLRKATYARSCSENHRSSHLENRFGRILRSQVFRTLTKACVYMTIFPKYLISMTPHAKRSTFRARYNEVIPTDTAINQDDSSSNHFRNELSIFAMQRFFCSMFGWTYRLSVVEIFECPSKTLTVL